MLPGDFQKKLKKEREQNHYHDLDDTEKKLQKLKGFFNVPENIKGEQDIGELEFLVFYFENKQDYELVREYFEIQHSAAKSHPNLDTEKLVRMVKNEKEG